MTNNNMQEIYFDTIIPDIKVSNEKQVFNKITNHVSNIIGTSEKMLMQTLMENDENKNAGIGNGVAIAHARLPRLTRPILVYATLNNAVEFNAVDDQPVDLVAVVLSPDFEGPKHLQRLSNVTRFFRNNETCNALRDADGYDGIRNAVKHINEIKKAA